MLSESVHRAPTGPLDGVIARYDGYRQKGLAPARHLGAPSPYMTMIVTLDEPMHMAQHVDRSRPPASYRSLVGGLHTEPVVIEHDGAQSGVQLSISPLASRGLFGVPAGELAAADLPGDDVLGRFSGELQGRLAEVTTWPERFAVLDTAFTRRLQDRRPPQPVIDAWALLTRTGGMIPISRLAREVGWSERQLGKRFEQEIGLTPKLAARLIRFDGARHALMARRRGGGAGGVGGGGVGVGGGGGAGGGIARIAADCGYHDQSHLVRDFKSFMGLAPARWLAQEFGNVQADPILHA